MIGYLQGALLCLGEGCCLLNVQGVGYEVWVHQQVEAQLHGKKEAALYIHHVVREDQQTLYGFLAMRERDLFRIFLQASGVGPKLALTMLASLPEASLLAAISEKDVALLKKIKGVGQRVAEKMVVELAPRLKDWCQQYSVLGENPYQSPKPDKDTGVRADVLSALASLGYDGLPIANKVKALQQEGMTSDQLLRRVLQSLSAKA